MTNNCDDMMEEMDLPVFLRDEIRLSVFFA